MYFALFVLLYYVTIGESSEKQFIDLFFITVITYYQLYIYYVYILREFNNKCISWTYNLVLICSFTLSWFSLQSENATQAYVVIIRLCLPLSVTWAFLVAKALISYFIFSMLIYFVDYLTYELYTIKYPIENDKVVFCP